MAAITDLDSYVEKLTGGDSGVPDVMFVRKYANVGGSQVVWVSGGRFSTWLYDGIPGGAVTPTTVAAPTKSTQGAIPFTNPSGGRAKWLANFSYVPNAGGHDIVMLYDRLLHIGGLDGTVTSAQTVGGTLTRNTGGVGNLIFAEIYTSVGTSAQEITASYTNQAGTSGRTTTSAVIGGSTSGFNNSPGVFITLPLQVGDTGVQSVQSVTLGASTNTAGDFGITVGRPLTFTVPGYAMPYQSDLIGVGGIPEISADACLAMAVRVSTSTESAFTAMLSTLEA